MLGCILPWKPEAIEKYLQDDGRQELMMDRRQTSCFVIKFGTPSEQMAKNMWEEEGKMVYASSANPSGKGNRGKVAGIGERIESKADIILDADDYVASIQPEAGDACPIVIRKGLDIDKIMMNLANQYNVWDYRHGQYY